MQLLTGQVFRNKHPKRQGRLIRIDGYQGSFAICRVITDNNGKTVSDEDMITVRRSSLADGKLWKYERMDNSPRASKIKGLDAWLARHPIKIFAKESGHTQRDIASICGVSYPGLKQWYKGSIPKAKNIEPLAKLMGMTPEQLIEEIKNWKSDRPNL